MIVPNKVISFGDSIIGKMPTILNCLSEREMTVEELYLTVQDKFEEVDEFIYALDVLYLLDAIEVDFDKGVVTYVKKY